jgi:aspartyl-tRNA(Asn)/glutamyl-tRNA(Gln) amidotransferase subunit A
VQETAAVINRRQFLGAVAATALAPTPRAFAATGGAPPGIADAGRALRRGALSPVDLTRACLERIEALNPRLNAFITVTADAALATARERAQELARGRPRGPLHGIPLALKDNIDTAGVRTTAAAKGFGSRVPATDAAVVTRLKDAGAILLGKLNMDECAYGVTSTSGFTGAVSNPWDPARVAGGSSGGPAAAVAAGLCHGALGTDTGGSIRQPAAWCGITGLKPTAGLVSARGVIPLAWSLDHVGPMTRTAADAALLLRAIAGFDPLDPASVDHPAEDYTGELTRSTRRLRLGLPRGDWFHDLDPEVEAAVTAALAVLRDLTAGIREVDLPPVPSLSLLFVEAAAYLKPALDADPAGFSPGIHALVETGGRISATNYAEAKRQLALARHAVRAVFADVDLLVTPTTPDLPGLQSAGAGPPRRGPPLSARNTTPFNIYGLPTVSIPCGFSRSGLPIGLQVSGPAFADGTVLALAAAYQQRTGWEERWPG